LHQPAAGELRFITTAIMKIVTDLERIGDQAVNIAQRVLGVDVAGAHHMSRRCPTSICRCRRKCANSLASDPAPALLHSSA
jgi:hypothetical protein